MDQKKLEECNLKVKEYGTYGDLVDMPKEKKEELFPVYNLEMLQTKFNKTLLI